MKELQHLNQYFIKYKLHFLGGIAITIIAQFFALYTPKLVNKSITTVTNFPTNATNAQMKEATWILTESLLLIIGTTLVYGFLTFLMRQTLIVMSRHVEYDLKNEVYAHYQKLSLNFYKQNRIGDLMNRISEDVGRVRMYVGPAVMYTINTLIRFAVVIIYMWNVSPKLTIYTLLPLPLLSYTIYKVSAAIHVRSTKYQENLSNLSSFVQEFFSGIRVVKAFALENDKEKDFEKITSDSKTKNLSLAKINALFGPLMILLIGLSNLVVIFIGGKMYLDNEITQIGVIAEFILYVNMLTWPVASIGWVSSLVQEAEASQKRINQFLKIKPDIEDKEVLTVDHIQGKLHFQNVSFTYPDTGIEALKNISFEVKPGQTLAIIGKTGSGKTTLLSLINRLYEASSGEIFIDGIPIQKIPLGVLRDEISVVPQDGFLFSMTIADNVKFGKPEASQQEIEKVCEMAYVHHNIIDLKDGYQTMLGERGINLSGGQKQRISIARALLKEHSLILFDDCLSAVDMETEEIILKNLYQVSQNKTTIIVSHRVSSVKHADYILVLEEGKILEQGTHNELVNLKGTYANLLEKQLQEKEMK